MKAATGLIILAVVVAILLVGVVWTSTQVNYQEKLNAIQLKSLDDLNKSNLETVKAQNKTALVEQAATLTQTIPYPFQPRVPMIQPGIPYGTPHSSQPPFAVQPGYPYGSYRHGNYASNGSLQSRIEAAARQNWGGISVQFSRYDCTLPTTAMANTYSGPVPITVYVASDGKVHFHSDLPLNGVSSIFIH